MVDVTVGLTGQESNSNPGILTVLEQLNVVLLGQEAVIAQSAPVTYVEADELVSLTGQEALGAQSKIYIGPNDVLVFLTGQEITSEQYLFLENTNQEVDLLSQVILAGQAPSDSEDHPLEENAEISWLLVIAESPTVEVIPNPNIDISIEYCDRVFKVPEATGNIIPVAVVDEYNPADAESDIDFVGLVFWDPFDHPVGQKLNQSIPPVNMSNVPWTDNYSELVMQQSFFQGEHFAAAPFFFPGATAYHYKNFTDNFAIRVRGGNSGHRAGYFGHFDITQSFGSWNALGIEVDLFGPRSAIIEYINGVKYYRTSFTGHGGYPFATFTGGVVRLYSDITKELTAEYDATATYTPTNYHAVSSLTFYGRLRDARMWNTDDITKISL